MPISQTSWFQKWFENIGYFAETLELNTKDIQNQLSGFQNESDPNHVLSQLSTQAKNNQSARIGFLALREALTPTGFIPTKDDLALDWVKFKSRFGVHIPVTRGIHGSGSAYLARMARVVTTPPPPRELTGPKKPTKKYLETIQGDVSDAGNVLGTVASHLAGKIGSQLEVTSGDVEAAPPKQHFGVDALGHSVFTAVASASSLDEAHARYEAVNATEMKDTKLYEEAQMAQMTPVAKEAYIRAREAVVAAYLEEKPFTDAFVRKLNEVGRPDVDTYNKASVTLDKAVSDNDYLQSLGVGPEEFQILLKRKEYEDHQNASPEIRDYLRARAYGQERVYVIDTLTHEVSVRKKAGLDESQWKPFEDLALKARDVYDRMIEGKELKSTDLDDISRLRNLVFPYQMNWNSIELRTQKRTNLSVKGALDHLQATQKIFQEQSRKLMKGTVTEAIALNAAKERASMKREQADYDFQIVRLEEEFKRLKDAHPEISEDDLSFFKSKFAAYKDEYQKYRTFWSNFASGNDVNAREHARNGHDKNVLFNLVFGAQWALQKLYQKYPVTNAAGEKISPSCVSLTYVNALRVFAEAMNNGTFDGEGIHDYFDSVFNLTPDVASEIGIAIPWTKIRLGGRKVIDNNAIDALASNVGATSTRGPREFVIMNLDRMANLVAEQMPHAEAANMTGFAEAFQGLLGEVDSLDKSRRGVFFRGNHSGILEFMIMTALGNLGIKLPQSAQDGMTVAPVLGDYVMQRAIVNFRSKGTAESNRQFINFLFRALSILIYPSGTRITTPAGGHLFADYEKHPELVLAHRTVTDRFTSGQDAKIFSSVQVDYYDDFLVVNIIHNGNEQLPEPTWFLGGKPDEMILGNLSAYTMLNAWKPKPIKVMFGTALSSKAYLSEAQWREAHPELFVNADGSPMSARESYVQTLQLSSNVMTAMMGLDAAEMSLADTPDISDAQVARNAQLAKTSDDERKALSLASMDRHLEARRDHLQKAYAHQPNLTSSLSGDITLKQGLVVGQHGVEEIKTGRHQKRTLKPVVVSSLSESKALELAKSAFKFVKGKLDIDKVKSDPNVVIDDQAKPFILEAIQRGAAVATKFKAQGLNQGAVALDLDFVMWDHFFVATNEVSGLVKAELKRVLSLVEGNDDDSISQVTGTAQLNEVININPQWVAFMLGYKEVMGHAPVLFSSTISTRLQKLAGHMDTNPLVRAFFEAVLDKRGMTVAEAQKSLSEESLLQAYREGHPQIITREIIAEHTKVLLNKYRENAYSFEGMSDDEKTDIETILSSKGDVHLKLRSISPYQVLVDDRSENVKEAHKHEGVTVLQPETFIGEAGDLYWALEGTHRQSRLLRGRNGQALEAMRFMMEPESSGRHVRLTRSGRPERIRGLKDSPVEIQYTRAETVPQYEQTKKEARDVARDVLGELAVEADRQHISHQKAKFRLIEIFNTRLAFSTETPNIKIRNALKILNPSGKEARKTNRHFTEESQFNLLLDPVKYLSDEALKAEALALIEVLRKHDKLDTLEKVSPVRRELSFQKQMFRKLSQIAKIGPDLFTGLGIAIQSLLGDSLRSELSLKNIISPRELLLLARLGKEMEGGALLGKMSDQSKMKAYGIAAERIIIKLGQEILARLGDSQNVADETKKGLRADAKDLNKEIKKMARAARGIVEHLGKAFLEVKAAHGDFKDLLVSMGRLTDSSMGEAVGDVAKKAVKSFFKERVEVLMQKAAELGDKYELSVPEQIVYVLLDIIGNVLGSHSQYSQIVEALKGKLDNLGLEGFVHELKDAFGYTKLLSDKSLKEPAEKLVAAVKDGNLPQANSLLASVASYFRVLHDPEKASSRFHDLLASAYLMAPPTDQGVLDTIVSLGEASFNTHFNTPNQVAKVADAIESADGINDDVANDLSADAMESGSGSSVAAQAALDGAIATCPGCNTTFALPISPLSAVGK